MSKGPYNFPVSNPVEAIRVTHPDFDVDLFSNHLYVDLNEVRGSDTIDSIMPTLGIIGNELTLTPDYVKIIFSGHRGCGKTSELRKLHCEMNEKKLYCSIFISIEEEVELSTFQAEDLYLMILLKLIEFLEENKIKVNQSGLKLLAKELFQKEEVVEEFKKYASGEASFEKEAGLSFFGWLKAKANFKAVFGVENNISREVRTAIRLNLIDFIGKINSLLVDVRQAITDKGLGQELLFIIDGSEKTSPEVYENIFVKNANVLKQLACNMVLSASISMGYKIETLAQFSDRVLLPMIKLERPHVKEKLHEVLGKRIDIPALMNEDTLPLLIEQSGGCLRQFYILANVALQNARGIKKVDKENVKFAILQVGQQLYDALEPKHFEIIEKAEKGIRPLPGDPETAKMLYGLALFKYNGEIKVNPVVTYYMQHGLHH